MTDQRTEIAEIQASNLPAGSPFDNEHSFELAQRMAKALCNSRLVPKAFQGDIADCMIALEIAHRLNVSAMSVLQNLHIIEGKPSFSAKFMISAFNASPDYGPMRYEWKGKEGSDERGCRAVVLENSTEEFLTGPWIDIAMAKAEGWYGKRGSKWQTIPEKMLMYRAAAWFIDVHAPELMLAAPSMGGEIIDVDPVVIKDPGNALSETMAEATRRRQAGEPLGEVVLESEHKPRENPDHY